MSQIEDYDFYENNKRYARIIRSSAITNFPSFLLAVNPLNPLRILLFGIILALMLFAQPLPEQKAKNKVTYFAVLISIAYIVTILLSFVFNKLILDALVTLLGGLLPSSVGMVFNTEMQKITPELARQIAMHLQQNRIQSQ